MIRSVFRAVMLRLPAPWAVSIQHRIRIGRWPNLKAPRTFNEKIQHRKLTDRDPRLPRLADKIEVKRFVAARLGEDWVTPTLWSGERLPPSGQCDWPLPFVLKSSHGSGQMIMARTAADLDWPAIERQAHRWISAPYAGWAREWAYEAIPPRLLVESFIGGDQPPDDYKLFVFDGHVAYIQVDTGRFTGHRRAFFDPAWVKQPFTLEYPLETADIPRPASLDRMIAGAEALGQGFSFVRVDLYDLDGAPRFGEMTFYPESGGGRFRPYEYDDTVGGLWSSH
jgi:hypothetical protein